MDHASSAAPAGLWDGRYRLEEMLGRGSAGVVHRAHDTLLDRSVALKTVEDLDADGLRELKSEFRSLSRIAHPNLVELYELVAREGACFFTMQLVDGASFVDRFGCGRNGAARHAEIRGALPQLAAGLDALHERGKLHCDIKPQNVLVDSAGNVVLIDFGLSTEARRTRSRVGGTAAYMAPEQMFGAPGTASDWYGVGAMLFEALTGEPPPFDPRRGTGRRAPRPADHEPSVPADLDEITSRLLDPEPASRWSGHDVLERLRVQRVAKGPPSGSERGLVGRAAELGQLMDFVTDESFQANDAIRVTGPSGVGKTALVEEFVTSLEERGASVYRSRCHPQESVPFQAFDGVIDDLHLELGAMEPAAREALVHRDGRHLARVFPVLNAFWPEASEVEGEPHEIRRRAFAALRRLLDGLGRERPTLIWIDDLQWADFDSAVLMEFLRRPRAPRILWVASHQDIDGSGTRAIAEIERTDRGARPPLHAALGPLTEEQGRILAEKLSDEQSAAEIASSAGGNPLLISEFARFVRGSTDAGKQGIGSADLVDLIRLRTGRLPDGAVRLARVIALSEGPVSELALYRLGGGGGDSVARSLSLLQQEGLIRKVAVRDQPAFDMAHARIRLAVAAALQDVERRELHAEVSELLAGLPELDPDLLVTHFMGAGDPKRAADQCLVAAEAASREMAFEHAARLYRSALRWGASGSRWQILARLGEALVNAGRGEEGAEQLRNASRELSVYDPGDLDAVRWLRLAAEHYMRSGHHEQGLALMIEVLEATGGRHARTPTHALASMLFNRVRLWASLDQPVQPRADATRLERERMEACWSAGVGLAVFDGLRAADFNLQTGVAARRIGDTGHLARVIGTESLLMAWEGGARKRRRSERLRGRARALAQSADPNTLAHVLLMSAVSAFYEMRLQDALELSEEGEALCRERCSGAWWELATLQVLRGNTLACLGDLDRLGWHLPEVLRQARDRGDEYCKVTARIGYANLLWLAQGLPEVARAEAEDALAGPFPRNYNWQVYQGALALCHVDLFEGRPVAAWKRIESAWQRLREMGMLRFQSTRVEMRHLHARCALERAAAEPESRPRMLSFARREARRIRREDAVWTPPFAASIEAGLHALSGDRGRAATSLEEAARGYAGLSMPLHESAANHQAARLRRDRGAADRWLAALAQRGVKRPEPMAQALVSGSSLVLASDPARADPPPSP